MPVRIPIQDEVVNSMHDLHMPLQKLRDTIDILIEKYGEDTMISCDGGHNNVIFELFNEISDQEIVDVLSSRKKQKKSLFKKIKKKEK